MKGARLLLCGAHAEERQALASDLRQTFGGRLSVEEAGSLEAVEERIAARLPFDLVLTGLNFERAGGGTTDGLRILAGVAAAWPRVDVLMRTRHAGLLSPRQVLEAAEYGIRRETWFALGADEARAASWGALCGAIEGLLSQRAPAAVEGERAEGQGTLGERVARYAALRIAPLASEERFEALPEMVGCSAAIHAIWQQVRQAAPTPATVLITGETGTGKEMIARALHRLSGRQPLVSVNCGALADELLASELFGHLRGAFTGADADRPGLLESAGEGTLLLDEIGEMSLQNQAKLLRVLQQGEYRPVGASTIRRTRARILAATHCDLNAMVDAGEFRADLRDRLRVYRIQLPPLRERKEDIVVAAIHHLDRLARELDRPLVAIEPEALWALVEQEWPENMRQLIGALERTLVELPLGADRIGFADLELATFEEQLERRPELESPAAIWQKILRGDLKQSLSALAKAHGKPLALQVVRLVMHHYRGLPTEEDARRLFGMSYRNWQHWAHYNGLTWDKVRGER